MVYSLSPYNYSAAGNKKERYVDFAAINHSFSNGFDFPLDKCIKLASRGITPFIILDPLSKTNKENVLFDLNKIYYGEYDLGIRRFAMNAKKFGKPIVISFCPGINNYCFCSSIATLYKEAYNRIADIFKKEGVDVRWVTANVR